MFQRSRTTSFKLVLLAAVIVAASYPVFTQKHVSADNGLNGIEYGFDRNSVPNFDKQALYVVFYGIAKKGVDPATGRPFPSEPRTIFSRVYRLGDLPIGYNWNSESLAPHQIGKIFLDHLIREYGFSKDRHEVKYLTSQYLNTMESNIREMLKSFDRSVILVPDLKFSFKYRDKNYVRPYSIEYMAP